MTIQVRFIEPGAGSYESWHRCAEAPKVGDLVDIMPLGKSDPINDEVVATVERREWYDQGRKVVCYVVSRH